MTQTVTRDGFLNLLARSGLVPADVIAAVVEQDALHSAADAVAVARAFVRRRLLTTFQANRLLGGKHRRFFVADRYKVLDVLGLGGMGWVYCAEDTHTPQDTACASDRSWLWGKKRTATSSAAPATCNPPGRLVALKMLTEKHETDAGMIARFELEAQTGMKLRHDNLVRTLDFGRTEGIYGQVVYMTQEFFEAISVEELLKWTGRLSWPHACDIAAQVAAGLHHAHSNGVVHRDVKPGNFLIGRDGHVKLIDFGLSLTEHSEDEFSLAMIFGHDCLGTADFIAPEQSLNSMNVDGRADIYSLGCSLYTMLSGHVPFEGLRSAEKVAAHRNRTPKPIRHYVPELPRPVEAVLMRMMARRPTDRFQTAADVCLALLPFAKRKSVRFDMADVMARRMKSVKRRIQQAQAARRRIPMSSTSLTACSLQSRVRGSDSATLHDTAVARDTDVARPADTFSPPNTTPPQPTAADRSAPQ
ncbi:MAG: serine/threonine protein kinase [Planctomycetota bacterium]|nr:MAG: serine/threonine protein kinase [Planctomycetota bacterium]